MVRETGALLAMLLMTSQPACSKPDGAAAQPSSSAPNAPSQALSAPEASGPPLTDLPTGEEPVSLARAQTLVAPGKSRVTMLAAGAEPRQPLSLPIAEMAPARIELEVDIGLNITLAGAGAQKQPVPAMRVAIDLGVAPAGDGRAELDVALSEVKLAPNGDAEQQVAEQMEALLGQLRGLRWKMPFGPHGPRAAAAAPKSTPVEVLQLWGTIDEALGELLVPMPTEPLGVGGRWRVFDRVRRAGVELLRRSDYTLVARDGESLTLRATVSEAAIVEPAVRDPALPKGLTMRTSSGSSKGKRELKRPVASIVPQQCESTIVSRVTTLTTHDKSPDKQRASLVLEQTLRMSAAKPPGKAAVKGKD